MPNWGTLDNGWRSTALRLVTWAMLSSSTYSPAPTEHLASVPGLRKCFCLSDGVDLVALVCTGISEKVNYLSLGT